MKILNNKKVNCLSSDKVYVGRPTRWGNPFTIGKDGDRDDVIRKFREWAFADEQADWRIDVKRELKGKDLICWCAPLACHAEVLRDICEPIDKFLTNHQQ